MKSQYRPLFITGYARSGTTLLSAISSTSPGVNPMVKECTWITRLVKAYREELGDIHTDSYFDSPQEFTKGASQTIKSTLDAFWERFGNPGILALKDPELIGLVRELCRLIPESSVALIIRDARDVIASQVRRVRRFKSDPTWYDSEVVRGQADLYALYHSRLTENDHSLPQRHILADRIRCIRYETLVQMPSFEALGALLDIPGLGTSPLWNRCTFKIKNFKDHEGFSQLWGAPVSISSIGSFAATLHPEDTEYIMERTRETVKMFSIYEGIQ